MKSNLLDTHTLIWFLEGSDKLSKNARNQIEEKNALNFVSVVSLWEMAIKISLKKLKIKSSLKDIFELIEKNNFAILPIDLEDLLILSELFFHHGDPFDRLLIAQAQNRNFTLLSKDENFKKYKIRLLW